MNSKYLSLDPLIPWRHEDRPIHWASKFGREAPLEVEIGFGLGDFLVRQARENPRKDYVGIELGWVTVRRTLRKIALAGVSNVRILLLDARVAFERLFCQKSLNAVYALFPFPWPKKRHVKHRFFSHGFFKLMNSRLLDHGEALIVTDYQPYLQWILSQVSGTGLEAFLQAIPPQFQTKYERKWQSHGQRRFYQLRLIKRHHIAIPLKEDIVLLIHRVENFEPEGFVLQDHRGDIIVEFREVIYDPKQKKSLVSSVVKEENFLQTFWIEIAEDDRGWRIRPAKGCGIIPTLGAQRALDLVREAVVHSTSSIKMSGKK